MEFKLKFPDRLFDVGIAEEHAVSMAGGLAKQGMIPIVAIYSTFLQRAYDMILQDVCLLGLHVVFAVDRAGLVGEDGETHHGVFDVGFLRHAPGLTVLSPGSTRELRDMLTWAILEYNGPVAIRYPRGFDGRYGESAWSDPNDATCKPLVMTHKDGTDAAIITYGNLLENAIEAASLLEDRGLSTAVIRLMQVTPLPAEEILLAVGGIKNIFVMEECLETGGVHSAIAELIMGDNQNACVHAIHMGSKYVSHGSVGELHKAVGLDADSVTNFILEVHHNEN